MIIIDVIVTIVTITSNFKIIFAMTRIVLTPPRFTNHNDLTGHQPHSPKVVRIIVVCLKFGLGCIAFDI